MNCRRRCCCCYNSVCYYWSPFLALPSPAIPSFSASVKCLESVTERERERVNVHSLFGSVCVCEHMLPVEALPNTLLQCCPILDDSIRHHFYYYDWSCVFIFYCFFVLLCGKVGAVAVAVAVALTHPAGHFWLLLLRQGSSAFTLYLIFTCSSDL